MVHTDNRVQPVAQSRGRIEWTVRDHNGNVWGPYSPSTLLSYVLTRRLHPDWRASDGVRFAAVREAIREAMLGLGVEPPGAQAEVDYAWWVHDASGHRWGPYGPAWLLWYVCEGRVRADWSASDGARTAPVFDALSMPRPWTARRDTPEQVRCPGCGALVRDATRPCPYCGTDPRSMGAVQHPNTPSVPQFVQIECPGPNCKGMVIVPIDAATRRVWCLDCGRSYDCVIGRACSVDGYVIWERTQGDDGHTSSGPTDQKKWHIRYQTLDDDDVRLLDFKGSIDIVMATDDIFVCLTNPSNGRPYHISNLTLNRSWAMPPGCLLPVLLGLCVVGAVLLLL